MGFLIGNVPNLRFPEFDGEWEVTDLKELGEFVGGGTPSSSNADFWKGSIPWISSSDLLENDIHSVNISRFITEDAIKNSATKLCSSPVILIVSRVGVGKVAYSEKILCTSQDFLNIINFKCNGLFLSYLLSIEMKKAVSIVQGTSIKGISSSEIKSKKLSIPQKDEQQKIASFISLIDERIQTQSKIIEGLKTLILCLRNQIFMQKIRFKNENGTDFSEWNKVKIGDILKIGSGKDYKYLQPGNIPVFGTGGFMTSVNDYLYDGETVCVGRKGTIDKPMYHKGKIWTVDTLFYTHSFQSCIPKFIFHLFRTINWLEYNEASGVPSLSKTTIEKIKVQIPSLEEQHVISRVLSAIDKKIQIEKTILEQLEKQKKYLLKEMFI
ncbi:restriction endonuclease subunit S [Flavobacterium piscis]|uniref:Type I restriction enzyme S subunit n=1 Tax=Flavobacterium piscis TaxID=1114874 RepID=A0ABU1Y6W1_9FLAO|nr:restriction endonuclease subunit S [Flavobacterium piscis]MDR7209970.1 type I restriction enzyme S subunit [Flavobacterium piscis]